MEDVVAALSATAPLAALDAEEESIRVTVQHEADANLAAAILSDITAGSNTAFAVQSDLVTLAPSANGTALRSVLTALDETTLAEITTAWSDDRSMTLHLTSVASVETVAAALETEPQTAAFETISLSASEDRGLQFSVSTAPEVLEATSRASSS